jgi:hypothetical protein
MKAFPLFISLFALLFLGCEKEQNNKLLNPYLKFEVDGVQTAFASPDLLNNNYFDCVVKSDTALIITVSKLYEGAGFSVKGKILNEGTYTLNEVNKAYYTNPKDYRRYTTNENYTGTITVKRGTFQAKTLLNTLQGTFSFQAVDTAKNKSIKIVKGEFLMELAVQ